MFFRKPITVAALAIAGVLAVMWLGQAPLRAADPVPVACPNGQTIVLEGPAPPSAALLVILGERPVGGGVADPNGFYRIPLRANERPGVYPVEVRLRGSAAVVARFTCFVDVPLEGAPETPTFPAPAATRITRVPLPTDTAPAGATPVPTATLIARTPLPTGTTAPASSPVPVTTPTPERTEAPSPTAATTGSPVATATAGPTTTPGATTTVTATPIPNANSVRIINIVLRSSAAPGRVVEYVELRNTTTRAINMTGWRLINVNRSDVPPFIFPQFVIEPADTINVYSAVDENDPDVGEFYWKRTDVWRIGDRAELRDASDRLISFLIVSAG